MDTSQSISCKKPIRIQNADAAIAVRVSPHQYHAAFLNWKPTESQSLSVGSIGIQTKWHAHIDLFVFYLISVISVSLLPNQKPNAIPNRRTTTTTTSTPVKSPKTPWNMNYGYVYKRCAIATEQFPGNRYRRDRSHTAMDQADAFQREYRSLRALLNSLS